jgi:FixJ family two-component response regulator
MNAPRPLLLVEDDPEVSASLRFWLQAEGFDVQTYATANALLEAGVAPHGVLIVDEVLPDGSGSALIRKIRANGIVIPAIVITTNPSRALQKTCAEDGVKIVEKPLISDELIVAIRSASDIARRRQL